MLRPRNQKQLYWAPNPQQSMSFGTQGPSTSVPVPKVLVLSANHLAALVPAPWLTGPEKGSDWHKITQPDGSWVQPTVPSLSDGPSDRQHLPSQKIPKILRINAPSSSFPKDRCNVIKILK